MLFERKTAERRSDSILVGVPIPTHPDRKWRKAEPFGLPQNVKGLRLSVGAQVAPRHNPVSFDIACGVKAAEFRGNSGEEVDTRPTTWIIGFEITSADVHLDLDRSVRAWV